MGADRPRSLHDSWHRGDGARFLPSRANLAEPDAIERYVLDGWAPDEPILSRGARVLTIGSCFAQEVAAWLRRERGEEGEREGIFAFGAGFVNTFTLRRMIGWALGREEASGTLYMEGRGGSGDIRRLVRMPVDEEMRASSRAMLESADALVVTLGLSEVWEDAVSGEVFFGAIPERVFDPMRHRFRVTTVDENWRNIELLVGHLRESGLDMPVVVTLSPVPLIATFRPVSAMTASSVSKAILRVAIDEMMRHRAPRHGGLYYFPAFEIVTDVFGPAGYLDDRRHVRRDVVDVIMRAFARAFIRP